MSRKWQRNKRWLDEAFPRPVKWVLRVLASVWTGITLLVCVVAYGILASVPIGLLALIPTLLIVAATLLAAIAVVLVPSMVGVRSATRRAGRAGRFLASFFVAVGVTGAATVAWYMFAWPLLSYEPTTGEELRLFAGFVEQYESTTMRRLPGVEMTELEFYAWWPLRLILVTFVLNMFVATVLRIEFCFRNIGVLTVHTGIIVIALGSVFYQRFKLEGDTILLSPTAMPGAAGPGPAQSWFYDNTEVVLYVSQRAGITGAPLWEQRLLRGLPRYNDYNLDAGTDETSLLQRTGLRDHDLSDRDLEIDVSEGDGELLDADIGLRVIGYANYAEPADDWMRRDPPRPEEQRDPMRRVDLLSRLPAGPDVDPDAPAFQFHLFPRRPAHRVADNGVLGVEFTQGMPEDRWTDLTQTFDAMTGYGLIVEIPETGLRTVLAAAPGQRFEIGTTGYYVGLREVHPTPPFPIITPGYEGATSSIAILEITQPDGTTYERWVYHRFPEISQDLLAAGAGGRPERRAPDPSIRTTFLDFSGLQIFFDEQQNGEIRAAVRQPGGVVQTYEGLAQGDVVRDVVPQIDLAVSAGWDDSRNLKRPIPVVEDQQDQRQVGTHESAMVAVEVSAPTTGEPWTEVVWVPFTRYMGHGRGGTPSVTLPDGRRITLAFGRRQHRFPGFQVQLVEFEMIAYDHRGAPRDFQSHLHVSPSRTNALDFEPFTHVTRLNAPLRAPHHWSEDRTWAGNTVTRLVNGLNPNQFKLSQAAWDQPGWTESQQLVDQGLLDRPRVNYTIVGVGNNPGIHVIAVGSVLMGLGIPWAFYVKPWLIRREKLRLQAAVAAQNTGADVEGAEQVREEVAVS